MILFPPGHLLPGRAATPLAATPATELRGVWMTNVDSDVLMSTDKLKAGLARLARLRFNTVYPAVWNWGYTLYPSPLAESVIGRSHLPNRGLRHRDMLAEAVAEGHQLGLAVIPWFEFGLMAPAGSELAQRHPDWLTQRQDGTQVVMEGLWPRVWLNPFHPDVQQFIVELITELVETYDVDGIQLDDHFGLPRELGYDPYTVQIYRQEHNGQSPPADVSDPDWMRWRSDRISQLMVQIFNAVKAHDPNCILSLSPNTQDFSYRYYLQDWGSWERRGYVEEVILQVYRDSLTHFRTELERPEVQQVYSHIPLAVGILTGLKNQLVSPELIRQKVDAVRQRGLSGVAFFFYETLDQRDGLLEQLFPEPAERPLAASLTRRVEQGQATLHRAALT